MGNPEDLAPTKSFSIGLDGSPDLIAAQRVADYIGSEHYSFTFTVWRTRLRTPCPRKHATALCPPCGVLV